METSSRNFRQNFVNRAKSFFYQLRWFFCLSTPEDSKDVSSKSDKKDLHLQLSNKNDQTYKFVNLPAECKLKICSFLPAQQKGMARLVCLEWKDLLKASCLWQNVDLTSIKLICKCSGGKCSSLVCYDDYKRRMRNFVDFIASMEPHIKSLKFSFDMIDCDDGWADMLHWFLESVHVSDIHAAEINWMNTPEKPQLLTRSLSDSSENLSDLFLKQRRRHRRFEYFFDFFTQLSFRLKCLTLPFEWTERSLHLLCRLKYLEVLVLHQCTDNHSKLEQKLLDQLLETLPNLKHLAIEATFSNSFVFGQLFPVSESLQILNLKNCTGVIFTGFNLVSLHEIYIGRKQSRSCFLEQNSTELPCLYDLLGQGTPSLKIFNGFCLPDDWKTNIREELNNILEKTCNCSVHETNQ